MKEETIICTEKVICIKNTSGNTSFTIGEQYEITTVKFTSGRGAYQTYSQHNGFLYQGQTLLHLMNGDK